MSAGLKSCRPSAAARVTLKESGGGPAPVWEGASEAAVKKEYGIELRAEQEFVE